VTALTPTSAPTHREIALEAALRASQARVAKLEAWDKRREGLLYEHEVMGMRCLIERAGLEARLAALTEAAQLVLSASDINHVGAAFDKLRAALQSPQVPR
jgi:hypothetical protein